MYDTGIIQQSWYMDLTPRAKALWWQLHAMMDNAGVFEINERMMEVMFGEKVTKGDIFKSFGNRVQPVPEHPDKGIFVDYIAWTNPRGLSKSSPSQRSIIARLEELGLTLDKLNAMSRKRVKPTPTEEEDEPEPEAEEERRPRRQRFVKPTVAEVAAYVKEIGAKIDPQGFVDYYESSASPDGRWLVGKRPMRDWKAAVRNWERMRKERGGGVSRGENHSTNWRGGSLDDSTVL
jgi:hypothetical protein